MAEGRERGNNTGVFKAVHQKSRPHTVSPAHRPHLPGHIGIDGASGALKQYLQPLLQVLGRWTVLDTQIEQLQT